MKNLANKAVASLKTFVIGHRAAVAFTVGLAMAIPLGKSAVKSHDEFLKEHGLYDEFYGSTEE